MKVKVDRDEYWPYFSFTDDGYYSDEIELSEDEYKFIKKALDDLEEAQAIIREKLEDDQI